MNKSFAIIAAVGLTVTAIAGPTHYSKLGIVTAARKLGRLNTMNAWIQQAGYWNEWLACQVFSDDYEGFDTITNAVVASGLATSAEISAVLEASRVENVEARLRALVESDKSLRERYHGGKIGQYILTNSWHTVIRPPRPDGTVVTNVMPIIIRVDLYGDGTVWTNGTARPITPVDPEAKKKAEREAWERREAVIRAWEAANLPPDLAELRRKQREAERRAKEAED